jgi:hypothetical protein
LIKVSGVWSEKFFYVEMMEHNKRSVLQLSNAPFDSDGINSVFIRLPGFRQHAPRG